MKAVVIGKCFLCSGPMHVTDGVCVVWIQSKHRRCHQRCADSSSNIEAVTHRVTTAFPGTERIGIGIGIKEYLLTQGQKDRDILREELAPSWHDKDNPPKVGDVLIGLVVAVDIGQNAYGPYPILTIADEDDNDELKAWHGFGTVGINQFNRARPKVGERIRIACTQVASQRGVFGDYTAWEMRVQREVTDDALDRVFGVPENRKTPDQQKLPDEEPPF